MALEKQASSLKTYKVGFRRVPQGLQLSKLHEESLQSDNDDCRKNTSGQCFQETPQIENHREDYAAGNQAR